MRFIQSFKIICILCFSVQAQMYLYPYVQDTKANVQWLQSRLFNSTFEIGDGLDTTGEQTIWERNVGAMYLSEFHTKISTDTIGYSLINTTKYQRYYYKQVNKQYCFYFQWHQFYYTIRTTCTLPPYTTFDTVIVNLLYTLYGSAYYDWTHKTSITYNIANKKATSFPAKSIFIDAMGRKRTATVQFTYKRSVLNGFTKQYSKAIR